MRIMLKNSLYYNSNAYTTLYIEFELIAESIWIFSLNQMRSENHWNHTLPDTEIAGLMVMFLIKRN